MALFLRRLVEVKDTLIEWEECKLNGMQYRDLFLMKLLRDVISCSSFKSLVCVMR